MGIDSPTRNKLSNARTNEKEEEYEDLNLRSCDVLGYQWLGDLDSSYCRDSLCRLRA